MFAFFPILAGTLGPLDAWAQSAGPWGLCLVLSLAAFFSEDLAVVAAGLFVAGGRVDAVPALGALGFGIVLSNGAFFMLGYVGGSALLRARALAWMVPGAALSKAEDWINERGALVLWITRFVPASRAPVYCAAGCLRMGRRVFLLHFLTSTAVWLAALFALSLKLGAELNGILIQVQSWGQQALLGGLLMAATLGLVWWLWLRRPRGS